MVAGDSETVSASGTQQVFTLFTVQLFFTAFSADCQQQRVSYAFMCACVEHCNMKSQYANGKWFNYV